MRNAALALVAVGALFVVLAVVYGYVFGVWVGLAQLSASTGALAPTKTGETVLFAFLGLALPLLAVPLAVLSRHDDRGGARIGTAR